MKNLFFRFNRSIAAMALGAALALAGATVAFTEGPTAKTVALDIPLDQRPVAREQGGRNSFAPVVKQVTPAVVKIVTKTKAQNTAFSGPPGMDDMLRRFFGDDFNGQ